MGKGGKGTLACDLRGLVRGEVRADALSLAMYSTDASIYQIEPLCVVVPLDEQDVVQVARYASAHGLSVMARGAGSGLAGECLGRGIVLDFSRYMNSVVRVDIDAGQVTVQSGVVLDQLNRQLARHGKKIGPDPASGNRATIGGMIGNNATGAHSLKYGYISRHLKQMRAVSADGQVVEVGQHAPDAGSDGPVGWWVQQIHGLLTANEQLLAEVKPRSDRNGSGYNVYPVLADGQVNLAELLGGSEGTLALVTEATLGLVDTPAVKALLQVNFESLGTMALALPHLLELVPAACELMDGKLLGMAREAFPQYHDVLPGDVAASLLLEFDGPDAAVVAEKLRLAQLKAEGLPDRAQCIGTKMITEPDVQDRVWAARKAAVPLLFRAKGTTQPIPVIEDIAVNPEQLAEYLEKLGEITQRLNVPMAYYAHAGHGELHTRPYLDLHRDEDVKKLRQLAEEVFKLVWSLGGTISGEHGEGLVRVSFIKGQYGPQMYELFGQIKHVFDPKNVLNPGKIINDDPDVMVKDLRFSHAPKTLDRPTNLVFGQDELVREIEQCNGDGLCRSSDPLLTMCPIFRATGDEDASPRAKVNLMRHWLYGLLDSDVMETKEFREIADLCINCKMCALQCPSLVNTPKLMLEAKAQYVKRHGLRHTEKVLTHSEMMSRLGSAFGPVANVFLQAGWFRRLLQLATGLDHRRPMPKYGWRSNIPKLRRYLRAAGPVIQPIDKVAYFVDLYATYNDHQLGRAVVDILRHNKVEVIIPDQLESAMPAICYGALDQARRTIKYNIDKLAEVVGAGYKVVCSEPTAAQCLKQEYLDLIDSEQSHLVAENTYEISEYLWHLHSTGRLRTDFTGFHAKFAYHTPCHYRALNLEHNTAELLGLIEGVQVERLPNSCCGLAGTFGFQKKNFDLSLRAGAPILDALRDSDADYGLTECATCKMQMELADTKNVLHPMKVLAQAYGLLDHRRGSVASSRSALQHAGNSETKLTEDAL